MSKLFLFYKNFFYFLTDIVPKYLNFLRLSLFLFIFFLIWSSLFKIDQVIPVRGQVIAYSKNQVIQAFESGYIDEIVVNEGDLVEKGSLLVKLNTNKPLASYNETFSKVLSLEIARLRVLAEISNSNRFLITDNKYLNYSEIVANQNVLFKKRRKSFIDQLTFLKLNVSFLKEELLAYRKLNSLGEISKSELLKIEKQYSEAVSVLNSFENKYFQDLQLELNKIDEDLSILNNVLLQKKEILDATSIFSPVDGYVKNIKYSTIGGVLKSGDIILEIVPTQSGLLVESKIPPSKIGFVKIGQLVNIKFDSFDYSIYGTLIGRISYISPDSISDSKFDQNDQEKYYRVNIEFDNNMNDNPKFKSLQLIPGLTVGLDINIGERSIFSIIFKPIVKTVDNSFSR